jgi:ATP-dependent Lon protease
MPKEAEAVVMREFKRLKKLHPSSAEWSVARTYLDVVADLPWSKHTQDVLDISKARSQLDGDHFGYVIGISSSLWGKRKFLN